MEDSLFREIIKAGSSTDGDKDTLLKRLSENSLVGKSSVLSSSSFYDFLRSSYAGRKVYICNGTACLTAGRHEILKKALSAKFSADEIGTVSCLGHCHTGNAFLSDNKTLFLRNTENPEMSGFDDQQYAGFYVGTNVDNPVLFSEINDLDGYYGILNKYADDITHVLKEIELSALRGRGGAGFPLHIKLNTSATILSDKKFVVCNADEGDPGAYSDKWILEKRPHSVLFGMIVTGLIIGADSGVIYVRGEYPETMKAVKQAIEEFKRLNLILNDRSGKGANFTFHLFGGAGAYICGEETSLLNSLEGLRPEVRSRPPFPATYGLFGKPTILCNVETFANLWFILNEGGAKYSDLGTEKSKGTKLVSLDSAFRKPGVFEVEMGTPLNEVLYEMGGGTKYPVKAFQIGGPLGGIIPSSISGELNIDFESFTDAGFLLGHAGIVAIPEDFSMLKFIMHLFEFTSVESCGKCFPCRIGSRRGYELLKGAAENGRKINKELFSDLLETMHLGSLCALGGGLPLPVLNALHYFSGEFDEYFQ